MPKYLIEASYTSEGVKGLLAEGGTKRRDAAVKAVKAAGGKVEAFYFSFGKSDVVVVVDFPDNVSAAAASLAINASGAVTTHTTVLLTPAEIDEAGKKSVTYRAPGQ
ncbi:MAG TPA: GYD domain-containing protein [Terriglobia bacterium]|nr:GYD domain-containing protein [Terriglobia bacterium]